MVGGGGTAVLRGSDFYVKHIREERESASSTLPRNLFVVVVDVMSAGHGAVWIGKNGNSLQLSERSGDYVLVFW